jgi:antirestriction protein ArdC
MDQQERSARYVDLLRQLGEQVASLTSSERWQAWLEVAARFHDYSVNNQLLILAQRPDASRVAGYRTWQKLGRQVRKGEKGISIFAPMVLRSKDAEEVEETRLAFRLVRVFDIDQTVGEPLAEVEWPVLATMPDAGLHGHLVGVCESLGLSLATAEASANGTRGWYEPTARRITIVDNYPLASQCRTLLHELAHSLDPGCHRDGPTTSRAERELVAESAAYLVGKRLGLAVDECSTYYVASWGGQPKELERVAVKVLEVANELESAVLASADGEGVAA